LNYCKRKATVKWTSLDAETFEDEEQTRQSLAAILQDEKSPEPTQIAENRELCRLVQIALDKLV